MSLRPVGPAELTPGPSLAPADLPVGAPARYLASNGYPGILWKCLDCLEDFRMLTESPAALRTEDVRLPAGYYIRRVVGGVCAACLAAKEIEHVEIAQ